MTSPASAAVHRGIVKQALSGDAIIIRGQPRGGPPPERTICFSNITAPRLARRANPNLEASTESKDEPYAWEAREFVRKKLVGKEVVFTVEYKAPGSGREYGVVYLGKDTSGENMTEAIVNEGLAEIRRMGLRADDENQQRLVQMEDAAKAAGKGKWAPEGGEKAVRDIKWTVENPRQFVESFHQKPIDAIIEHVRDGCTVRAFLLPDFYYVTVMLSGIKCPMFKQSESGNQVAEPFAEEARFFTESRLLQREVQIILEGAGSNQNLQGTVLHPNGNIAEALLREGFSRCVDWSMGVVSQGADKLRAAEKIAKEKKQRIWKDYKPSVPTLDVKEKSFQGKVVEIVNGDGMVIKIGDTVYKKIFLASIKPPRPSAEGAENQAPGPQPLKADPNKKGKPLYDIPYMFEAREFLRKKLIGKKVLSTLYMKLVKGMHLDKNYTLITKVGHCDPYFTLHKLDEGLHLDEYYFITKVNVEVDYIQPPNMGFPEKHCCTITIGGINVAEALISKGLATVIRYRMDDDQRSAHYDLLLSAEARAQKKGVGLHSKKEPPIHRVADIAGDVPKAKQFLPFLQRAGRSEAIVEFVASGSRLRLYIPRETCLITFLISGIECPRGSRPLPGGGTVPADPFGEEALVFTKEMCLQREVEVEVEAIDKGGNFIGWLHVEGVNLSVALVENGLAKVHFTAERSPHFKTLQNAEETAKSGKKYIWSQHEEQSPVEVVEEPVERTVNYKNVIITEVGADLHFYAQNVDNGPQLEKLMEQLRQDMESDPPLPGSHTPKKGDLCAAKFSADNQWYRAKVDKQAGPGKVLVRFIDYGNKEVIETTKTAPLPPAFHSLSPQAQEYLLACVTLPGDEDAKTEAEDGFYNDVINKQFLMNVEYKSNGMEYVSLLFPEKKEDVAQVLIAGGWVLVEPRKEKRLAKIVSDYTKAQESAKSKRLNLWRYGDFTEDEAKEFGYQR